jgi:NADH-quinone oxidoreductase subunit M
MILSLVTFLPLCGALMLLIMPREEEGLLRGVAFTFALATFGVSLLLLELDPAGGFGFVVDHAWVPSLGIRYHLGVDGISLWLVLLTTFLVPVVLLSATSAITKKVREFVVAVLILETGMVGTFLALDLFVFYVFWEVMLIPMYFIIGIWGGDRRLYASIKFVLYTMVGSLLMIVAILYLYVQHHDLTQTWTFDYAALARVMLPERAQLLCYLAFALAFCIKVPLFPLHTWLPDAHVEAPTAGSVLLAAVMLKFGTYGLLRFALPLFPHAFAATAPYLASLAVVGIVYASLVAWAQTDVKKLIAYSSVAHLGFVVLGLAMLNVKAVDGAVYQMLAHGISTGGLFLCIGALYERRHTRRVDELGGIAAVMPRFSAAFLIITLASIGLPGLSGFVGEFLVLLGTYTAYDGWGSLTSLFPHPKPLAGVAATGVILGAVYMLFLFQKVMFGPLNNPRNRELKDLSTRELAVFEPVVAMAFWLGLYPSTFLSQIDPAVTRTLAQVTAKYAAEAGAGEPSLDTAAMMPEPGAPDVKSPAAPTEEAPAAAGPEGEVKVEIPLAPVPQ